MVETLAKFRDIPELPDYVDGQTDHDYMHGAWARGPLARDRRGLIRAFPAALMSELMDDRWTRQIEMESMQIAAISGGPVYDFFDNVLLFSNGQVHRNRRGPLVRTFAHRVIEDSRPAIAARCERMVAELAGSGPVDFVGRLASPLPAHVIASIIGAPEGEVELVARHVYSAIRGLSLVKEEVWLEANADMAALAAYVERLIASRRAKGADDFLTRFLDRVEGGPLDEAEIRTQIMVLVLAGSDTTRGALTSTVSQLMQNRDQWQMLVADPDRWVPAAVSEGLRYDPVIGSLARILTERHSVAGYDLPAGTFIGACMLTSLRDPAVYADPHRFDITRTDHPKLHPIFGGGPHRCLGEALARLELEEALKALVRLAPDMELESPPARLRGYGATRALTPMVVRM
ncbi:cytochrome P450 [Chachezhania sediminis]|uniref:cytochrome P450 n=1 Tax=Chachezhania sediminis TaxID=2599291 RepID=UPI00131B739D|nr:cytochrome P450 [Chachezhania sediminis]